MTKIPKMTRAQEGEFWETHDATDYLDEMESVSITTDARPESHCSACDRALFSRYIDVDLADGRAQLRGLRQIYCPAGHRTRLSPESQRLVHASPPYEVHDSAIHKTWFYCPVLVELRYKPEVRLDWEHTEFTWIKPAELTRFDAIPNTAECLQNALLA